MGMVWVRATERGVWVGRGACFLRWDLGKARMMMRKHSEGSEPGHHRQLTPSEHEGDLGGQVWKMCGRAGMTHGASFALRI
jgi:hypothetical protein